MDATLSETIDRYNDAWNAQDVETIARYHHPEIVFQNHTAGERVEGAEAVSAHNAGNFARCPDLHELSLRAYNREDIEVSEWTATATHPDGRKLEWDGIDVFPFRDGLIARKDVYSTSGSARVLAP